MNKQVFIAERCQSKKTQNNQTTNQHLLSYICHDHVCCCTESRWVLSESKGPPAVKNGLRLKEDRKIIPLTMEKTDRKPGDICPEKCILKALRLKWSSKNNSWGVLLPWKKNNEIMHCRKSPGNKICTCNRTSLNHSSSHFCNYSARTCDTQVLWNSNCTNTRLTDATEQCWSLGKTQERWRASCRASCIKIWN